MSLQRGLKRVRRAAWTAAMLFVVFFQASAARAAIQVAGTLAVSLDARDASAGTAVWANAGTLGSFTRVGTPTAGTVAGQKGVSFNGTTDLYRGPATSSLLEGAHARSIEVWVLNPAVNAPEETMVAWGRRGTARRNLGFNFGSSGGYGAVTHYDGDMGWGMRPAANAWRHLVYTYDGTTVRIYDNTVRRGTAGFVLNTYPGDAINIAAQNGSNGQALLVNEFDGSQMAGSLWIAAVRVHTGALSEAQILNNFNEDAARFGAVIEQSILTQGYQDFAAGELQLRLIRSTQTVAALEPTTLSLDYTPGDILANRIGNDYHHLGDLNFRTRTVGTSAWTSYSSAASRSVSDALTTGPGVYAAAALDRNFPADCPLAVERRWLRDAAGRLVMRFQLRNRSAQPVEIGALGIPVIFNNVINGKSLEQAHEFCSFYDPYIGRDGGYLQVCRLKGDGPILLVLPEKGSGFEAYRPLNNDPTPRGITFEGFYEWMIHSKAYSENDWAAAQPWNSATSRILQPDQATSCGLAFVLSESVRTIDAALVRHQRPVAVGLPGYVVPTDQTVRLFLHAPAAVRALTVEPAGALVLTADAAPTTNGWRGYSVQGVTHGRARLNVAYDDGTTQTVHYRVTAPLGVVTQRMGEFLNDEQWYVNPSDPFGRNHSYMQYDRQTNQIVLQDDRSWVVGLSDEAGAGAFLTAALKTFGQPVKSEVDQLEQFVDEVMHGRLQNPTNHSVRASLFYYQPNELPAGYYTVGGGWNRARSETTWRTFNYLHPMVVYWSLYRLARNHPGLVSQHTWDWYLQNAYDTIRAIDAYAPGYASVGLMEGDVIKDILQDLRREGWNAQADWVEAWAAARALQWSQEQYPFGSEMPWDSTGQEEVYCWTKYFGYEDKAQVTLRAILAYMPTVPHWAYNGSARRYWDFMYGGKWRGVERQLHHYGSSINAIPVLSEYRQHPDDFHLLRIGYGGTMGVMTNVNEVGHASCAFHGYPQTLEFDPFCGDYGPAYYGHSTNIATYVVQHPEFGWLAFGGNLSAGAGTVRVVPLDSYRMRVYLAPYGLWLTLDAGTFEEVEIDLARNRVRVGLAPADAYTPQARLRIEQPAAVAPGLSPFRPWPSLSIARGAYEVPLGTARTWVTLIPPYPAGAGEWSLY